MKNFTVLMILLLFSSTLLCDTPDTLKKENLKYAAEADTNIIVTGKLLYNLNEKEFRVQNTKMNGRLYYKATIGEDTLKNTKFFDEINVFKAEAAVTPTLADELKKQVEIAEEQNRGLLILLDTPGGLVTSSREIEKDFLDSDIPVIVYIHPRGARAASAGVFITYSSHIAAADKGTHLGAASPVSMQGEDIQETMKKKVVNDLTADIQSVADLRKRDKLWGEEAVKESAALSSEDAYKIGIIDILADDLPHLKKELKKYIVEDGKKGFFGFKDNLTLIDIEHSFRYKVLSTLADPSILYILMTLGMLGIYFEFSNPGAIAPGAVGAFCLLISFYGLSVLPVNWAGFALIILAFILFILEVHIVSFGTLTIGGIIAMILGSIMLFDKTPALQIPTSLIVTTVLVIAAFTVLVVYLVAKAHSKRHATGFESMKDKKGKAIKKLDPEGQVFVRGEIWKAESEDGSDIEKNEKIVVVRNEGLKLFVKKMNEEKGGKE